MKVTQPHTHRRKQWNSHSHNHKYTHTHVNIRTYIPAREQGRKGKERKSKAKRERSGAGLGEVTNNKYTHTQAKMWEKRLNENYFKLFRKREERKERRNEKKLNEAGNGKGKWEAKEESVNPLVRAVLPAGRFLRKPRGELEGNFVDKEKGWGNDGNQFAEAYFLGARSVLL